MQEVQPDHGPQYLEVPDDWHPDPATLDFIAQIVTQELVRRGNRHGLLAKGSDRHENQGAMVTLQALALALVNVRKQVQSGAFGQTGEETNAEPESSIITSA